MGSQQFSLHFRRVGHDFPILCGQNHCDNTFTQVKSLLRHIKDFHIAQADPGGAQGEFINQEDHANEGQGDNIQGDGAEDGAHEGGGGVDVLVQRDPLLEAEDVDLTRSAAMMVLNLRQTGALTSTSIERFQDECFKMMVDSSNSIKVKLINFLTNENLINTPAARDLLQELNLSNPFLPIRTLKQQLAYFAREMGLVVPVPLFLDWRPDFRLNPDTNQYEPTQVAMTFEYVPIMETLKLILSNPKMRELIDREQPSQDGVLRSYLDGTRAQANDLIMRFPKTLRIQLNWDDLEVGSDFFTLFLAW